MYVCMYVCMYICTCINIEYIRPWLKTCKTGQHWWGAPSCGYTPQICLHCSFICLQSVTVVDTQQYLGMIVRVLMCVFVCASHMMHTCIHVYCGIHTYLYAANEVLKFSRFPTDRQGHVSCTWSFFHSLVLFFLSLFFLSLSLSFSLCWFMFSKLPATWRHAWCDTACTCVKCVCVNAQVARTHACFSVTRLSKCVCSLACSCATLSRLSDDLPQQEFAQICTNHGHECACEYACSSANVHGKNWKVCGWAGCVWTTNMDLINEKASRNEGQRTSWSTILCTCMCLRMRIHKLHACTHWCWKLLVHIMLSEDWEVHVYVWWGCNQLVDKTVKVNVEAITASARKVHVLECECACSSTIARAQTWKLCVYELCVHTHTHIRTCMHARWGMGGTSIHGMHCIWVSPERSNTI